MNDLVGILFFDKSVVTFPLTPCKTLYYRNVNYSMGEDKDQAATSCAFHF